MVAELLRLVGWRLLSLLFAGLFLASVAAAVPAEVFGRFSLAMSVVTVAGGGLLSLGNHALLRFGRQAFAETGTIGGQVALRLQLFAAVYLTVAVGLWAAVPLWQGFLGISDGDLPWLLLGLLLVPLGETGIFAAQAAGRFTGFGVAPAVARGIHLAVLIGLIAADAVSWRTLFLGAVTGYGVAAAFTWWSLPAGCLGRWRRRTPGLRLFAGFGWSIPLASLSVAVMGAVDLWFLRGFRSVEEVGVYSWIYAIAMTATALLAPLGALLANRYLDHVRRHEHAALGALLTQTRTVMLLAIGGCLAGAGVFLALATVLPVDLGRYAGAVAPGVVLLAGIAFQLGTNMWETMSLGRDGRTVAASLVLGLMALTNVLLDWFLVPAIGVLGAAFATSGAYLVGAVGLHALVAVDGGDAARTGYLAGLGVVALGTLVVASVVPPLAGAAIAIASGTVLFGITWAGTDREILAMLRNGLLAVRRGPEVH